MSSQLPKHIAIIMDGNGRWAKTRHLPRSAGHKAGVKALRKIVEHSVARRIEVLTVYAFSSENWRRPEKEVSLLMELFMSSLKSEVKDLHSNNVKLLFIGDRSALPVKLQDSIAESESLTADNTGLTLVVAANYGGRWDITAACVRLLEMAGRGEIAREDINESLFHEMVCLGHLPDPDLFIRTGGEKRISNFLLWQLAYTELYFTDLLWPEFGPEDFDGALTWYGERQRRFGRVSEQVE